MSYNNDACKFFWCQALGIRKQKVKFLQVKIFSWDQVDRGLLGHLAPGHFASMKQGWNPECFLLGILVSDEVVERIPIKIL